MTVDDPRKQRVIKVICNALDLDPENDTDTVNHLLGPDSPLHPQWVKITSMARESALSILTADELQFVASMKLCVGDTDPNLVSAQLEKTVMKVATDDQMDDAVKLLSQYSDLVESLVRKFSIVVSKEVAGLKHSTIPTSTRATNPDPKATQSRATTSSSAPEQGLSVLEESIKTLALRADQLDDQVEALQSEVDGRLEFYTRIVQSENLRLDLGDDLFPLQHSRDPSSSPFDSYDHIIEKLGKWGFELSYEGDDAENVLHECRQVTNEIVMALTNHCKTILNVVFAEALETWNHESSAKDGYGKAVAEEQQAFASEIESLWEEVIPVAHMAVESQFLQPLMVNTKASENTQRSRDTAITSYISAVLCCLNARLSIIAQRIQTLVCHHQALKCAFETGQSLSFTRRTHRDDPSSSRHTIQSSVRGEHVEATLLETLKNQMSTYGFPLTASFEASVLESYVQERSAKGDGLSRDLQNLFIAAVKTNLTNHEVGTQLAMNSVLSDSACGLFKVPAGVHKDLQLDHSITTLEKQTTEAQGVFQKLNVAGPASPPDFIACVHQKAADRLAAGDGGGYKPETVDESSIKCSTFHDIVRKWDHESAPSQ
ncbi:hypothetical protein F5Y15DRAFT_106319 [Xylariaceae sp. FL0016]|nr:hypothetical protein F5Y15DRAFT_106319 [Xylariaceae sp. FL0016]